MRQSHTPPQWRKLKEAQAFTKVRTRSCSGPARSEFAPMPRFGHIPSCFSRNIRLLVGNPASQRIDSELNPSLAALKQEGDRFTEAFREKYPTRVSAAVEASIVKPFDGKRYVRIQPIARFRSLGFDFLVGWLQNKPVVQQQELVRSIFYDGRSPRFLGEALQFSHRAAQLLFLKKPGSRRSGHRKQYGHDEENETDL